MEPLRSVLVWATVMCLGFREIQGQCARDQMAQFYINQCTTPMTTWEDFSLYGAHELCNQTRTMADCVDSLIVDCRNGRIDDEAIENIHSMIDIGHMKRSFSIACSEFEDAQHTGNDSACVMELYNETAECRRQAFVDYAFKIRLLQTQVRLRGLDWFETEQKVAACRYSEDMGNCAQAYNDTCGERVYEIYHSLFTGIRISNCPAILAQAAFAKERNTDGCPHTPRDAIAALRRCTAPASPITTFRDGLPTVQAVNDFCRTDGNKVAACLEKVVQCGEISPTVEAAINRTQDVRAMVRFLDFACVNNNLFVSQRACVEQKEAQVNECARNEYRKWLQELQELQLAESSVEMQGGFEQSVKQATCNYAFRLERCTVPWKFGCNFKLGKIFDSLFASTRDPACDGILDPADEAIDNRAVAHIGLP